MIVITIIHMPYWFNRKGRPVSMITVIDIPSRQNAFGIVGRDEFRPVRPISVVVRHHHHHLLLLLLLLLLIMM